MFGIKKLKLEIQLLKTKIDFLELEKSYNLNEVLYIRKKSATMDAQEYALRCVIDNKEQIIKELQNRVYLLSNPNIKEEM